MQILVTFSAPYSDSRFR